MSQKFGRRGILILGFIDGDVKLEATRLGFLLVILDIFRINPPVDLWLIAVQTVPDGDLVHIPSLGVVNDGCASGEVWATPVQTTRFGAVALPEILPSLADLIIYGGHEVFDSY